MYLEFITKEQPVAINIKHITAVKPDYYDSDLYTVIYLSNNSFLVEGKYRDILKQILEVS